MLAVIFSQSRTPVQVFHTEDALPPSVARRLRERRAASPMRMLVCGLVLGVFSSYGTELAAEGPPLSEWLQPPNVMMLVGMVFSAGIAWQEITQGRRRLAELEKQSIRKDTLEPTLDSLRVQHQNLLEQQERMSGQIAEIYRELMSRSRA